MPALSKYQSPTATAILCIFTFGKRWLQNHSGSLHMESAVAVTYLAPDERGIIGKPGILPLWLAMSKARVYKQSVLPRLCEFPCGIQHLVPKPCRKMVIWNHEFTLCYQVAHPLLEFIWVPCKNWICAGVHIPWFSVQSCQNPLGSADGGAKLAWICRDKADSSVSCYQVYDDARPTTHFLFSPS